MREVKFASGQYIRRPLQGVGQGLSGICLLARAAYRRGFTVSVIELNAMSKLLLLALFSRLVLDVGCTRLLMQAAES